MTTEKEVFDWLKEDRGRDPSTVEELHIKLYIKKGEWKKLHDFCGFPIEEKKDQ